MGLYDCMFLITEDQYKFKLAAAANGGGLSDGVIGDVQESQVNNIELNNGGTIVIGSTPPGKDGGGGLKKKAPDAAAANRGAVGRGRGRGRGHRGGRDRAPDRGSSTVRGYGEPSQHGASNHSFYSPNYDPPSSPSPPSSPTRRTVSYSTSSVGRDTMEMNDNNTPLEGEAGGEEMDTTSPVNGRSRAGSLRRQAISNSIRQSSEAVTRPNKVEKKAMDEMIRRRLNELQGKKTRTTRDRVEEQAILHDLKDIYRDQIASQGSQRPRSAPAPPLPPRRNVNEAPPPRPPRPRPSMEQEPKVTSSSYPPPPVRSFPAYVPVRNEKRKSASVIRKQLGGVKKSARVMTDVERREVDEAIEEIKRLKELEKLEVLQKKRKWTGPQGPAGTPTKFQQVSRYEPPEGRKRKPNDLENRYDDEQYTNIPYKSNLVTYHHDVE